MEIFKHVVTKYHYAQEPLPLYWKIQNRNSPRFKCFGRRKI